MASEKVFASEIVAYNDEELDRYLQENGRIVSVHDPKNLPESFIQRLRDRVHNANRSRPVDLDQVSARLSQLPDNLDKWPSSDGSRTPGYTPWSWSGSEPRTPSDEKEYLVKLDHEQRFYNRLVKSGGRPWYPKEHLEDVIRNPADYRELLRHWQTGMAANRDEWRVFELQYTRWKAFRKWQAAMRTKYKDRCLSEYTQWAKMFLLNIHSYTAPVDFEFEEDPKQQDQLTTFIEYLTYECNFQSTRYAWKSHRKWYKKQWRKLVNSGVLRPHETEEFILDGSSAIQDDAELAQARGAMESARLAVVSAQQTDRNPSQPSLEAAQSKLESASQFFDSIKRRNELIDKFHMDTFNYRNNKRKAEHHAGLLQWIRDQISLIELELKQSKTAEGSTDDEMMEGQRPKRQKRSAPNELIQDEMIEGRSPNGQKNNLQFHHSPIQTSDKAETAMIRQRKKSTRDARQSSITAQPLRRSARIAARQEAAQTVVTRSGAAERKRDSGDYELRTSQKQGPPGGKRRKAGKDVIPQQVPTTRGALSRATRAQHQPPSAEDTRPFAASQHDELDVQRTGKEAGENTPENTSGRLRRRSARIRTGTSIKSDHHRVVKRRS
ncbi:hypothetical protein VM1G_08979 [Cytospora mali]|uniref:Ankyrin 2,3/unc44 n=1 Tax=Cytospora mali TaxID=578113 RepID=A0A194WA32_CYTMA|nr:hypothetical protein VM1G_08979 [Valsa mali]